MIKALDPNYELPGHKYFSRIAIPYLYNKVEQDVQVQENCSVTTNMWSSVSVTPLMFLTVHIIPPEWKYLSKCLQTTYFPESHTGTDIAYALRDKLQEWQLDERKLVAITIDNAAYIAALIRSSQWGPHSTCFGHNLHLAVTNAVQDERKN